MEFDVNKMIRLLTDKLAHWGNELIRLLPNIVVAAVVLVLGLYVAKFLRRIAGRLFKRVSHNETLNSLFNSFIYIVVIGIVLFTVLSILNLDKAVTTVLTGAGILGLALAFAFQDIAANFMAGILISFRKPIRVGDIVMVQGFEGKVHEINLRDTIIDTFKGQLVIIPNKDVFQNPIENFSRLQKRRFDLDVGVSYGDDLDKVKQVALDAVKDIENVSQINKPTLFFTGFGDSSINFKIRVWIDSADSLKFRQMGSDVIVALKKAFDANDIMLPFPIRTLDFGIKGGKSLDEIKLNLVEKD